VKTRLDAFVILFSKDAAENRMISFADIREAYRRTIAHGKLIIYSLKIYSHTGQAFKQRKIMFETGGSFQGVQRELGNLGGLGIVKNRKPITGSVTGQILSLFLQTVKRNLWAGF
jgi:hypothetical protein